MYHVFMYALYKNEKIHTICKYILLTLTQIMKQSYNYKMSGSCD
jgi:hypothetical protein